MSATHHAAAPANSTAGLLLSLASSLPRNARSLERRARATAARLSRPHTRALDHRAGDLLALLLTAADGDMGEYPEEGLIDPDFDTL